MVVRMVDNRLIIHLKAGQTIEAVLARTFNFNDVDIEVTIEEDQRKLLFALDEVCAIRFARVPSWATSSEPSIREQVQTITGETFRVTVLTNRKYANGFIGLLEEGADGFQTIFFTHSGVRLRHEDRLIGEILRDQGVVSTDVIEKALRDHDDIRHRRMGEVLAACTDVSRETIELTIKAATQKQTSASDKRVGDILIEAGLVTREQVEKAFEKQQRGKKTKGGELLVKLGLITEEQLLAALAIKFRLPFVDLTNIIPTEEALGALSEGLVDRLKVLPVEFDGRRLVVATSAPTDPAIGDSLRFSTNYNIELVVATAEQISTAIDKYYHHIDTVLETMKEDAQNVTIEEDDEQGQVFEPDSEVVTLINRILIDAYRRGVSDIHFEPGSGKNPVVVRYRVDGECFLAHKISASFKGAINSRIKIMAALDISERRRPQSGKIKLRFEQRRLEYRVEITPSVGGQEDAVLRLLSSSKPLPLSEMGFLPHNLERFKEILERPNGIILCVGPTGSGKTTTLHSALGYINKPSRKIWTAEDPVEITQPGLRQVQVNPKIGFTFSEALRSFLRADPDVIMIGEMRDTETARISIEASLTGHLVFSTLHTNSAPETVVRLLDMGMDAFTFADAILGIVAQRLPRKLCDHCKKPGRPRRDVYDALIANFVRDAGKVADSIPSFKDATIMLKNGCEQCGGTGYKGRFAIHELLRATPAIRRAIREGAGVEALRQIALAEGMWTLRMDGVMKVFQGMTDLEHIHKVCM
jgi:type II secretory ATPase GspE/PulE/Tfp pilus assembly ATPase PilB-like protein